MGEQEFKSYSGHCTCGSVRYRLTRAPMFVHCCHCSWCQRETGSAFVINALVETAHVELLEGTVEKIETPSASGKGQVIVRCPTCRIALWSHYGGRGEALSFIRVGTLDDPDRLPPDTHIFTSTKQTWFVLPDDIPVCSEYYDRNEQWPKGSIERFHAMTS